MDKFINIYFFSKKVSKTIRNEGTKIYHFHVIKLIINRKDSVFQKYYVRFNHIF